MQIIPAIDLRDGRCVRLLQGDFARETVFADDPVAVARKWVRQGARLLHVVDLDGARIGRPVHLALLRELANSVPVPIQFGGGLRTTESVSHAMAAGATRVVLSTAALGHPEWLGELLEEFAGRILVSLDTRCGQLAVGGWLADYHEDPIAVAQRLYSLGLREIIHTSVERDGMMLGPDLATLRALLGTGLQVIAAGGISSLDDLRQLKFATGSDLAGVIIGRALYEHQVCLSEAIRLAGGVEYAG